MGNLTSNRGSAPFIEVLQKALYARRMTLRPWVLLALVCCAHSARHPPHNALSPLKTCYLNTPGTSSRIWAECGTLTVLEDKRKQDGRRLQLNVALVWPQNTRQEKKVDHPDPIVFLAGGPGSAATSAFPAGAMSLLGFNKRVVVLLDQRGTEAESRLRCPEFTTDAPAIGSSKPGQFQEGFRKCAANLDADPKMYTTRHAAEDLEVLRKALGYAQLNLYGISYGTRLALQYAQTYPKRVRAMVLDGTTPFEQVIGETDVVDGPAALDSVFSQCAREPQCVKKFGSPRRTMNTLFSNLARKPEVFNISHPVENKSVEVELHPSGLARALLRLLYNQWSAEMIPYYLDLALKKNDYRPLVSHAFSSRLRRRGRFSSEVYLSVVCAEDYPRFAPLQTSSSTDAFATNLDGHRYIRSQCSVWPTPPSLPTAKNLDTPTLLLAGGRDPVTPPRWSVIAQKNLSNSRLLIHPNGGHGLGFYRCFARTIAEFFNAGRSDAATDRCVQSIRKSKIRLEAR